MMLLWYCWTDEYYSTTTALLLYIAIIPAVRRWMNLLPTYYYTATHATGIYEYRLFSYLLPFTIPARPSAFLYCTTVVLVV